MRLNSNHPHHRAARAAVGSGRVWRRRGLHGVALATVAVLVLLATAVPADAAGAVPPDRVVAIADSVDEVLDNLRNWLMGILAALATVFLTIGGVRYVMAGGNPGEVEKSKTAVRSAGIGYGLAALAPLVVEVLKDLVGA